MEPIEYDEDEVLLKDWRPVFSLFLAKITFVSFLTALFLGSVSFSQGILAGFAAMLLAMAFYTFVFDDHLEWFRRRDDVWILTSKRLIFLNPGEDVTLASIYLTDIPKVQRWMWWAVKVKLANGATIMMMFLRANKSVVQAILQAKAALNEHETGEQE